jgi:hypothetical protein
MILCHSRGGGNPATNARAEIMDPRVKPEDDIMFSRMTFGRLE